MIKNQIIQNIAQYEKPYYWAQSIIYGVNDILVALHIDDGDQ